MIGATLELTNLFCRKTLLAFFTFLLTGSTLIWSQTFVGNSISNIGTPEIINFNKQQYGAHYQNWDATQDPLTGFMYFANSKGMLEYDGSNWKTFELPRKQIVRSVAADGSGKIYTGGMASFGYWEANEHGVLAYHSLTHLIHDKEFSREEIWHIIPYQEGVLFQSFAFLYFYKNGKVTKLKNPGTILFVHEVHHRLFVDVINKGLFEIVNNQFKLLPDGEKLSHEAIDVILPFEGNSLLVCTNNGLFVHNGTSVKPLNTQTNEFFQLYRLNRAIKLHNGQYLFGTLLNGIVLTDANGKILRHINQRQGLQNNTVLSLYEDKVHNVWVGLDKGIDLLMLSSPLSYFRDLDGYLGTVYDIESLNGWLYVGTNQGVYCKPINSSTPFKLVPKTQGQVWDLAVIDQQLFCGHNNGTLLIEKNQARLISDITGGWTIKKLKSNPNWLVQGTYTRLCFYKKQANGSWIFDHTLENLGGSFTQVEEDNNGYLWVYRPSTGINRIKLDPSFKKIISNQPFEGEEFRNSTINLRSFQNKILITSPKGIKSYQNDTRQFQLDEDLQKWLFGEVIHKIFPISANELYVLRKDGSLSYAKVGQKPIDVPIPNNRWVDIYENVVKINSGEVLVCTEDGFVILPPSQILDKQASDNIKPFIRSVSVVDDSTAYLYRFPPQNQEITLDYNENSLSIIFSTTSISPKTKYSYWLENGMKSWSPYQLISMKEFSNLQPGSYIFHLKSNQNAEENTISITILPPWYWNAWSKGLYTAIFIGINLLFYRYQDRKFRLKQLKERRKLERRLRRQAELSEQEIIRLRNEQLEQDVIRKSEELANSTMTLIKKNELLLEIKQEVDNLKKESGRNVGNQAYRQIMNLIDSNISSEQDWQVFESNFNKVHEEFLKKLIELYPNLTPSDLKLAAYLRMNLSSKEIAQLFNITNRSVELKRYRLRKKMELDTEINLGEFMMKI